MRSLILFLFLRIFLPFVLAGCKNFTTIVQGDGTTIFSATGNTTFRVSEILNCSSTDVETHTAPPGNSYQCNSTQCFLETPLGMTVRLDRVLSVKTSEDITNSLFNLVKHHATIPSDVNFDGPILRTVDGFESCIVEGHAAYWGFIPSYQCIDGTVSQCSGDGYPTDGTFIRACGNAKQGGGRLEVISGSDLQDTPPPPNGTLSNGERLTDTTIYKPWTFFISLSLAMVNIL